MVRLGWVVGCLDWQDCSCLGGLPSLSHLHPPTQTRLCHFWDDHLWWLSLPNPKLVDCPDCCKVYHQVPVQKSKNIDPYLQDIFSENVVFYNFATVSYPIRLIAGPWRPRSLKQVQLTSEQLQWSLCIKYNECGDRQRFGRMTMTLGTNTGPAIWQWTWLLVTNTNWKISSSQFFIGPR